MIKICNCKVYEMREGAEECKHFTPTADVEEVVRCIDCKHSSHLKYCSIDTYKCKRIVTNPMFDADFYCKYGERKEDG